MSFRAKREILCGQELEKIRFLPAVEMTDESPSTFYEAVKTDSGMEGEMGETGKTAVVTGTSSAVGRETVKRLSETFLSRQAPLDDDPFHAWLSGKTGLAGQMVRYIAKTMEEESEVSNQSSVIRSR